MSRIQLKREIKQEAVADIKKYFWQENNEDISDFQASNILAFFLDHIGPHVYNQAINDAYGLMTEKVEDLYGLEIRRFK